MMLFEATVWLAMSNEEAERALMSAAKSGRLSLREVEDVGKSTRYRFASMVETPEAALDVVRRLRKMVDGTGVPAKVAAKWWKGRKQ